MVIAYRMAPFSAWLMSRIGGYLPYVGLPNILAGRFVVPEFLQDDATPANLAQAVLNLYADRGVRASLQTLFDSMHRQLRQNAAEKAAQAVIGCLPAAIREHAGAAAG
jgi:lipid-A-disaccharide synthase